MATTLRWTQDLIVEECCTCGIAFGMPTDFQRHCMNNPGANGRSFYCPNGHRQWYLGRSEAQKERERAETAERRAEQMRISRDAARDQADAAERRRRAAKGQLTKVKKRVANGVCPCCNRTFADLAAHMSTKHPDYAAPSTDTPPASA